MPSPIDKREVFDAVMCMVKSPQNDRGLDFVKTALTKVPPEACNQQGNCLLNVAIEMACRCTGRGSQSYGY
jgi:hypothetical protein